MISDNLSGRAARRSFPGCWVLAAAACWPIILTMEHGWLQIEFELWCVRAQQPHRTAGRIKRKVQVKFKTPRTPREEKCSGLWSGREQKLRTVRAFVLHACVAVTSHTGQQCLFTFLCFFPLREKLQHAVNSSPSILRSFIFSN
jgi:hypothetical protein